MKKQIKPKAEHADFIKKVELFEKAEGQLLSLIGEFSELSKKKPDGAVNKFKLKYVNEVLTVLNTNLEILKPFQDFSNFDVDDLPSNSDVKMMLGQYAAQTNIYRVSNTKRESMGTEWYWIFKGEEVVHTVRPGEKVPGA